MKLKPKKLVVILSLFIISIAIIITTTRILNIQKVKRVAKMNSIEAINSYCSNKNNIVMSIGIIYREKSDYIVYGKNGTILPKEEHLYEIGSITKTFTTSLLTKAIYNGQIDLNDSISKFIKLNVGQFYPTIEQLATHTAGYGEYPPFIKIKSIMSSATDHSNFFYGYNTQSLIKDLQKRTLSNKPYAWEYSNFGMSALGNVLTQVYNSDYKTLVENYAQKELGLANTHVGINKGDLNGYTKGNKVANWKWKDDDAFLPAGSLVSNIDDMLKYINIQISGEDKYLALGYKKYAVTSNPQYDMGLGWILDTKNNIIWHNGETYGFNSFIGFDREKKIGVVIMANYAGQADNSSTIIGQKLLKELQNNTNLIFEN